MSGLESETDYFSWMAPSEMLRLTEVNAIQLGDRAMWKEGQAFRDAFVASRFAILRAAEKVRLLSPRYGQATPDFAILVDNAEQWFEVTEADRAGRKRQNEYQGGFRDVPVRLLAEEEWTNANAYKCVVQSLVTKKASKAYDRCRGLIVWSNAFGIIDDEKITQKWWSQACESGWRSFEEIWVHHRDVFHKVTRL